MLCQLLGTKEAVQYFPTFLLPQPAHPAHSTLGLVPGDLSQQFSQWGARRTPRVPVSLCEICKIRLTLTLMLKCNYLFNASPIRIHILRNSLLSYKNIQ